MATPRAIHKIVFAAPRSVEIVAEDARSVLGPREVRIRTLHSGISRGTEMNIFRGDAPFFDKSYDPDTSLFLHDASRVWKYPIEFGYENVGRIEEVGSKVTEFSTGMVVVSYQPHREESIIDIDSRDVLLGDVPPLLPLPAGLPLECGVFLPLLGVALNAMLDAQVVLTETVTIFGAGVVGLLTVQLCRLAGAKNVYVIEPVEKRRQTALKLGAGAVFNPVDANDLAPSIRAMTGGRGADVAIETSGRYEALHEALRVVGRNGRVVASSWYAGSAGALRLGEEFHLNRVRILSSQSGGINPLISERWDKARRTHAALELIRSLRLSEMITHRLPFRRAADAYRIVDESSDDVLQVVLNYQER